MRILSCGTSLPDPEPLDVPVARAFGPYRRFFPPEALGHPAKANVYLVERLLDLVSRPGDLVLDPFAGWLRKRIAELEAELSKMREILTVLENRRLPPELAVKRKKTSTLFHGGSIPRERARGSSRTRPLQL